MRKPAYYQFQLPKSVSGGFDVKPMFRYLNDDPMNYVFEAPYDCKVSMLGPVASINDYIGYALQFKDCDNENRTILLHTSSDLVPWGIGRSDGSDGAYIFRVDSDNVFELFIFPGKSDQAYQLLAMLQDGIGGIREQIDVVIEEVAKIRSEGVSV